MNNISIERLKELSVEDDLYNYPPTQEELNGIARELLEYRKASKESVIFHMGEAMRIADALKIELIERRVNNQHLGLMGAEVVEVWTSKIGGTLEYMHANGGCSLHVYTAPQPQPESNPVGVTDRGEIACLMRGEMANVMPPDYKGVDNGDEVFLYAAPKLQPVSNPYTLPDVWIKCSERMPDEFGRYWCYVEEQNSLGKSHYQWNCSWNGDCWSDASLIGRVTHWMPLAAAPRPEVS